MQDENIVNDNHSHPEITDATMFKSASKIDDKNSSPEREHDDDSQSTKENSTAGRTVRSVE